MFHINICQISGEATIISSAREIGIASFANSAQARLFEDALNSGARPARAAEVSGAIFVPAEK
jgi:hypothetical protein